MYEIILLTPPERINKQTLLYAVVNSHNEILCKFRCLQLAADFVRYVNGGDLFDESREYLLTTAIYEYSKLIKPQKTAQEKGCNLD